ncbi:MAG: hypothetical protein H6707_05000 [Deltaproteobacteria bacterium]|nr:hypothetical protein [Deltaproteobacteria bacterium]
MATPRSDDPIPPTRLAMPDGDDPIPPTRGPVETPTDDDPIPPTRDGAAAEAATPEDADSRPIGDDPIPPTRGVDEGDPDSLAPVVPVVVGGCPSLD